MKRPLISICIPTYNRSKILKSVLQQYIQNQEFDDEIEIVISDNASTDDTEKVCREICSLCDRIRYFRNTENIIDLNFIKVLDYAEGDYLKLYNDWAYCTEESLRFMKATVKMHLEDRRPIFFTSKSLFTNISDDVIECNSLNEYVRSVSTMITSTVIFGVWREQWSKVAHKDMYLDYRLLQVDWSYQIVANRQGCVLYNQKTFELAKVPLGVRKGYNWFSIHLDGYYQIMRPYIENGTISAEVYNEDKKNLLRHFKQEFGYALIYNYSKFSEIKYN